MQINTPENIVNQYERPLYALRSENIYALLTKLREYKYTNSAFPFGQYIHFTANEGFTDMETLKIYLSDEGFREIEIQRIEPNIEDCFMALMVD
jgi:hypothetical protein